MWILLDTAFRRSVPDGSRPWLLSVVVNTYGIADRRRSKRQVLACLQQLEQKAERRFADELDAVYAARINTESRLEFYFYARYRERFERVMEEIRQIASGMRVQALCKEDEKWSFYSYLCPNEVESLLMRNTLFLESLQARGDDGRDREIRHWMSFPDEEARSAAAAQAQASGFAAEPCEGSGEDPDGRCRLLLRKTHSISLDAVNAAVRELYSISSAHGGRYEGWGAELHQRKLVKLMQKGRLLLVPLSLAVGGLTAVLLAGLYWLIFA
ncbi:hypothetical protein GCM10027018_14980 [Paenibacillus thermoaerophilus]